ncbi:MAG: Vitamin B12 dependent methionine synthase activation subunit [Clostridia bacterium]|nr:Vitamin B12 dependent methionine synthase activation subunit [Clostridia bacterium]
MNNTVLIKNIAPPPIDKQEILRYAGCRESSADVLALMESCLKESETAFAYNVCYRVLDVSIAGDICDFGSFSVPSLSLAKCLSGYEKVVLFGATVGADIDRLIAKHSRLSPSRALMLQAIGAERIEALCDAFCNDWAVRSPRFSPGYGDLPLAIQKDIFSLLDCSRRIGLALNESLIMSPTKSVTAFMGIKQQL